MRLRAEQHLRRQRDFRLAREQGRRLDCGGFTLWSVRRVDQEPVAISELKSPGRPPESKILFPRAGVVASTAAVGNAVRRNYAKRRLREVFRRNQSLVPGDIDLLIVARRSLNQLPLVEIERKFIEACGKLFSKSA